MQFATIAAATSGNNTLVAAPASGFKLRVYGITLICRDVMNCYLRSGTAGTFHLANSTTKLAGVAASGAALVPCGGIYFDCDEASALVLNCDSTNGVVGCLQYDVVRV